jgi:hypothetical protein
MGLFLWDEWTRMWNGAPEMALVLCAERFVLHLPSPSGVDEETVNDPVAAERWVREHRNKFESLTFSSDVGPFVDIRRGVVAGPWIAHAVIDGKLIPTCGMDTIAFRDGKLTEYWTLSKPVADFGRWTHGLTFDQYAHTEVPVETR